jgi:hypothetical protein
MSEPGCCAVVQAIFKKKGFLFKYALHNCQLEGKSRKSPRDLPKMAISPKRLIESGRETGHTPSSPHDRAVLRSSDLRYGSISRYGTIGPDLPKTDEIARTGQGAHSARIPRRPEVAHGPSSQPPPAGRMRTCIAPTAADLGSAQAGPVRPLRGCRFGRCAPSFGAQARLIHPHHMPQAHTGRAGARPPEGAAAPPKDEQGYNLKCLTSLFREVSVRPATCAHHNKQCSTLAPVLTASTALEHGAAEACAHGMRHTG